MTPKPFSFYKQINNETALLQKEQLGNLEDVSALGLLGLTSVFS